MKNLILSSLSLLAGPLFCVIVRKERFYLRIANALMVLFLSYLIIFHVIPESFEALGFYLLPIVALGFAAISVPERLFKSAVGQASHNGFILTLGVFSLSLHTLLDGAALVDFHQHQHTIHQSFLLNFLKLKSIDISPSLSWGVIAHQFPVGLFVWLFVREKFGTAIALLSLSLNISLMVLGYLIVTYMSNSMAVEELICGFQGFMIGSLLHVVVEHRQDLFTKSKLPKSKEIM